MVYRHSGVQSPKVIITVVLHHQLSATTSSNHHQSSSTFQSIQTIVSTKVINLENKQQQKTHFSQVHQFLQSSLPEVA